MFHFDGGAPPWTSGLSQGTALQVLARAYSRFKETPDLTAAQQALGIFETPPPAGVRVKTAAGTQYAEYTYAPSDMILNGFIQSLVGLYDYTSITKDPLGLQLFEAGDAEARVRSTPGYDTGAWSLYDQFGESDLNYHELLTEFLQHLCERTRKGPPFTPAAAPAPTPTTSTPTTTTPSGGASAATAAPGPATATYAAASTPSTPIAGDQIYCTTAQHFTTYQHTPPADLAAHQEPEGRHARRRAGVAVEDLDRAPDDPPGLARGVDEQRLRGAGQAQAAVAYPGQGRDLQRDASAPPISRATSRPTNGTIVVKHR